MKFTGVSLPQVVISMSEKFEPKEYLVRTGVSVDQLTLEELQQEVCRLIEYLEEYSDLAIKLEDLEAKWRGL